MSSDFWAGGFKEAAKQHRCEWCTGIIEKGEKYYRAAGKHLGDFQDWKMHEDCFHAMSSSYDPFIDDYFCDEIHKRGRTCEEAGHI